MLSGRWCSAELRGNLTVWWTFQHQLYKLKAARGASPPCILVKFRKISPRNSRISKMELIRFLKFDGIGKMFLRTWWREILQDRSNWIRYSTVSHLGASWEQLFIRDFLSFQESIGCGWNFRCTETCRHLIGLWSLNEGLPCTYMIPKFRILLHEDPWHLNLGIMYVWSTARHFGTK